MSRVTSTAVNTDVIIPIPKVTAKPRTGPEPIENITTATMNVVKIRVDNRRECTIVARFNGAGHAFGFAKLLAKCVRKSTR